MVCAAFGEVGFRSSRDAANDRRDASPIFWELRESRREVGSETRGPSLHVCSIKSNSCTYVVYICVASQYLQHLFTYYMHLFLKTSNQKLGYMC